MKQLTVRDVPEEVVRELREEAAEYGQSLNAVLRSALAERADRRRRRRDMPDVLARMQALRQQIVERVGHELPDSTPLVREDRER